MLEAYERELPLSEQERFYLAVSLYYPEKVWKLIHHYYNSNKAWVPEKSAEKLEVFLDQDDEGRKRDDNRGPFCVSFSEPGYSLTFIPKHFTIIEKKGTEWSAGPGRFQKIKGEVQDYVHG